MNNISWKQKAKIAWIVLFHRKTPLIAKASIVGAVLYGAMPFDLIPDLLPLLGIVDDATLVIMAVTVFLNLTKALRREMEEQ